MTDTNTFELAALQQQAENGDAQSQFELAYSLSIQAVSAGAFDNNIEPMLTWLSKAAEQGHSDAQFSLGLYWLFDQYDALASLVLKQWATEKCLDLAKSVTISLIFVSRHNDVARENLQEAFWGNGEGIRKSLKTTQRLINNDEQAFRLLMAAAQQAHSEAAFFLGVCYPENIVANQNQDAMLMRFANAYMTGHGAIKPNPALALPYFEELAEYSEDDSLAAEACYRIAMMCFDGSGTPKDYKKGIKSLRDAIRKHHVVAQNWLDNVLLRFTFPSFVERADSEACYEYAYSWLIDAIEKNPRDQEVNFALGVLYASGKGTEKNVDRAVDYFGKIHTGNGIEDPNPNQTDELDDLVAIYCDIYRWNLGYFSPGNGLETYFSSERKTGGDRKDKYLVLPSLFMDFFLEKREFDSLKSYIGFLEASDIAFEQSSTRKHLTKIVHKVIDQEQALEDKQQKMQKLVEQFTHTLGNVIFPDTIYQVAERLKANPACRKDVLLLNEAYHSEITIKLQSELLRQRYANTNPETFRHLIRSCRLSSDRGDKVKSIADIFDYAVSRVTARFLNQHNASLASIRNKILTDLDIGLETLKQKFEDDILFNKTVHPVEWINQNLRPFEVIENSQLWQSVRILAESHAEALLFGYFSEVLFNAFKYADHSAKDFLTVVFDESTRDGKTYLTCTWRNPLSEKVEAGFGTGKGLDAIREDLHQLNDTDSNSNSLLILQNDKQFEVTMFFQKDLLINDLPVTKFKRKAKKE